MPTPSSPVIEALKTVGYTPEKIDEIAKGVLEVEQLNINQQKEHGDEVAEKNKLSSKQDQIQQTYTKHLKLSRIMFRGNLEAFVKLNLNGRQKKAYASWIKDVKSFYIQLTSNPDFLAIAISHGIPQAEIDSMILAIGELEKLQESVKKEKAEAQMATEERDLKFDEVLDKYLEMLDYAKVLLGNNQALESLGIVVKR